MAYLGVPGALGKVCPECSIVSVGLNLPICEFTYFSLEFDHLCFVCLKLIRGINVEDSSIILMH